MADVFTHTGCTSVTVRCCRKNHVIEFRDGQLHLTSHGTPEMQRAERLVVALGGGKVPRCFEIQDAWQKVFRLRTTDQEKENADKIPDELLKLRLALGQNMAHASPPWATYGKRTNKPGRKKYRPFVLNVEKFHEQLSNGAAVRALRHALTMAWGKPFLRPLEVYNAGAGYNDSITLRTYDKVCRVALNVRSYLSCVAGGARLINGYIPLYKARAMMPAGINVYRTVRASALLDKFTSPGTTYNDSIDSFLLVITPNAEPYVFDDFIV